MPAGDWEASDARDDEFDHDRDLWAEDEPLDWADD